MSWDNKVVWSEGMFLQPQHFQQHDRYLERLVEARSAPVAPYCWGHVVMRLDEAALKMGKIALSAGQGILPDGTPYGFPASDESPLALDVPADVRDELVYLAAPLRRFGSDEADLAGTDAVGLTRYRVTEFDVPDNNTEAERAALVQIGQLRLRLMLKRDVTDAYACVGVVRVIERRADNQLVLDASYIPPSLAVRETATLAGYVREIQGLLHQRGEALAARLSQPGRGGVAEIADFLLLQTVNRFEPVFAHFGEVSVLHPERLYATCLMLAGDLCTFSRDTRRPPAYPAYHHDDPATCFTPLINDLRRSLSMVMEQSAIPIELQDRKYGVRVAIIPDANLLKSAAFVLAVNAQMPVEALRVRFPTQVKLGPVERIRDLVNLQLPGIALHALPVAPRQIPYHAGFNYFELERSGDLWKQLERSGGLAMHIAGEFPGLELEFWALRT
ncbi:MAG: type VI secretion system baseplate subunit TssK [Rhodocyclaceae bacterium]